MLFIRTKPTILTQVARRSPIATGNKTHPTPRTGLVQQCPAATAVPTGREGCGRASWPRTLSSGSWNVGPMKCYTHNQAEAVAICVHCGRAVCGACATPSPSGRLVCSPACSSASKQTEEFVAATRNKSVRNARTNAYFCYSLGAIFIIGGVAFHLDIHAWPFTLFISAAGIGFVITGVGYMRVAQRNTEDGAG